MSLINYWCCKIAILLLELSVAMENNGTARQKRSLKDAEENKTDLKVVKHSTEEENTEESKEEKVKFEDEFEDDYGKKTYIH